MTDTPRPTAEQFEAARKMVRQVVDSNKLDPVATLLSDRDRLRDERDAAVADATSIRKHILHLCEVSKECTAREAREAKPQQVNALLTAVSENKRLRDELERAKAREIVLRAEIETRRNYPAIRGSAYFPKCPEHAAGPCDCPQCKWADACRAARNATDALPSPDAGQGEMGEK